jgi:hypothetical protein
VVGPRGHLPGAILGGVAFTALITIGSGLVTHVLKHASGTYGAFGTVIGIVAFLLLLAKLSLYAAELNPVLSRRLYPRALPMVDEPTEADLEVLTDIVKAEQRRKDQVITVGYGDPASGAGAASAAVPRAATAPDDAAPDDAAPDDAAPGTAVDSVAGPVAADAADAAPGAPRAGPGSA